jgi:hypothetical protein
MQGVLKSLAGTCHGSMGFIADRAGQIVSNTVYLRAAQAYMLISMPTGTSTILGVFQVIPSSLLVWRELRAGVESRGTSGIAQVRKIEDRTPTVHT